MGSKRIVLIAVLVSSALCWQGCGGDSERKIDRQPVVAPVQPTVELIETPAYSGDSAYQFVAKQVAFGPRVPNTEAHRQCADWLESKLASYGLETRVQSTSVTAYNQKKLKIFNIMGRYQPENPNRILLCAHWDSRPYADRDTERRTQPIDGANDGASGVGVLLELARVLSEADSNGPGIGVDIVFFDAEDYGKPESSMIGKSNDSWCLGSQYWAANIPFKDYDPRYGILLDMVGASNAVFPKEGASVYYAPEVVENVWSIARAMGHKDYFSNVNGNPITDDHVYLNTIAGIPTIDIIHYEMGRADFGDFHHTHADNMDGIDKGTLHVVGDVLLQVIYQE